jgi:hypothetical protein
VELTVDHADDDGDGCHEVEVICVSDSACPQLYHGLGEIRIGPLDECRRRHSLTLTFRELSGRLTRAYLLCRYQVEEPCRDSARRDTDECRVC